MARTSVLPSGKLDPRRLPALVFGGLAAGEDVVVGPSLGEDAAAMRLGEVYLVAASDPITGAEGPIGRLLVHVNANDVATMGARPQWFLPVVLLPESASEDDLATIMDQMSRAVEEVGAVIVGGHTEVTPGLDRPLVSGCMLGTTDHLITSSGIRSGDALVLTKGAAIEGSCILATDRAAEVEADVGLELAEEARGYADLISIVPEAQVAAREGCTAMHDVTEGGVLGALHELCSAGGVGFSVERSRIRISTATDAICDHFGIDPLKTISSGSLLVSASPERAEAIVTGIRALGVWADIIGRAVDIDEGTTMVDEEGTALDAPFPPQDHLWTVLDGD
jgi:hydrogenase maturation factor